MKIENFYHHNGFAILKDEENLIYPVSNIKDKKSNLENDHLATHWKEDNRACLLDSCPNCNGTRMTIDNKICHHFLVCPCFKCTYSQ